MSDHDGDVQERRLLTRLGLRNGLFVGLALALGVWAPDAISLTTGPVRLGFPSLLLGFVAVVLLGGVGGWLAAKAGRALPGFVVWLVVAVLITLVIGHLPCEGRTLIQWLADRCSWGFPIYPFSEAAQTAMVMAGFFIVLVLGFLGLIQPYRLEGISAETNAAGRVVGRGWFLLILPLIPVLAVGMVADNIVNRPLRTAPRLVHEVIRTGRTYPGDLFELSLESAINYNAIAGIRDQMSENYSLFIGEVDLAVNETVYVVAHFDNGAWTNCRVVMEQVSYCYDASPPYMQGFPALLTSGMLPEDCPQCFFRADDEQREWLQARSEMIGDSPRIGRLAQWGSHVLIQAESPDGEYVMQCLFEGVSPVQLQRCWDVKTSSASGFQLPQHEPPAMRLGTLARVQTGAELYEYLRMQMSWQAPGILSDEEYWQISTFLAQALGAHPGDEPLTIEQAVGLRLHATPSGSSP
jgi:hypothetical protein